MRVFNTHTHTHAHTYVCVLGAELLAKVDDALAVASGTLDSVAEDFGSIESIAGTNDTLSADIQAGLQGDIDAIGSNLTLLEAEVGEGSWGGGGAVARSHGRVRPPCTSSLA